MGVSCSSSPAPEWDTSLGRGGRTARRGGRTPWRTTRFDWPTCGWTSIRYTPPHMRTNRCRRGCSDCTFFVPPPRSSTFPCDQSYGTAATATSASAWRSGSGCSAALFDGTWTPSTLKCRLLPVATGRRPCLSTKASNGPKFCSEGGYLNASWVSCELLCCLQSPTSVSVFQLRNLAVGRCLTAQGRASQKGGAVVVRPCDPRDPEQVRSCVRSQPVRF